MAWLEIVAPDRTVRVDAPDSTVHDVLKHLAQGFRDQGGAWLAAGDSSFAAPGLTITPDESASMVWVSSMSWVAAGFDDPMPDGVGILARFS